MTETVKLKRGEVGPAKEKMRDEIREIANSLYQRTTEKMPIPRHVVDGTLSEVIAYKETAQSAMDCYHVSAPPRRIFIAGKTNQPAESFARNVGYIGRGSQ
jgi:hypothetical protein